MTATPDKKPEPNYQNIVLAQVKKDKAPVTIFLTNGVQIRSVVKAFDNYVLLVEMDGKQQMVFKHAISTVVPLKPVTIRDIA